MFGLSPEWLLVGDTPVADAMVLSHPEQLERLRRYCPQAAPRAVLAGDPCFDRMLAARPHRERFRRALGVRDGQRLILLNSTWNGESLFGDRGQHDVLPVLLPRLTSELPADEYRIAAVLHPNIWHGHGPGQIRTWLDRARRSGLSLIDPTEDWRQAVLAADAVIGDFGSVSFYAAALGTPVLLGAGGADRLDPDSPVAAFARQAPRLDAAAPLLPQLRSVLASHRPPSDLAAQTTSHPGQAAALLRRTFYGLIGISEPEAPARLDPLPLPPYQPPPRLAPLAVHTQLSKDDVVLVERYADSPRGGPLPRTSSAGGQEAVVDQRLDPEVAIRHLAVHEDTLDPGHLDLADILFRENRADDPRVGPPHEWTAEIMGRHPYAALAAYITTPESCTVRTRQGELLHLETARRAIEPSACVSALHGWLLEGQPIERLLDDGLTVWTGSVVHRVRVTRAWPR